MGHCRFGAARAHPHEIRARGGKQHQREQVRTHDPQQPRTGRGDREAAHDPALEHVGRSERGAADPELHQRFLADRRRPERDARGKEDEQEEQSAIQERQCLGGCPVPQIRADERDEREHEKPRHHVLTEQVVHDAGEPPHEVRLADVVEPSYHVAGVVQPHIAVTRAPHVVVLRVTLGADRAVSQDRRDHFGDDREHQPASEPRFFGMFPPQTGADRDRRGQTNERHHYPGQPRRREEVHAEHEHDDTDYGQPRGEYPRRSLRTGRAHPVRTRRSVVRVARDVCAAPAIAEAAGLRGRSVVAPAWIAGQIRSPVHPP